MRTIKNYENFLILEKFDDNIKSELNRLGISNEQDINMYLYHAHRGNLSKYLRYNGKKFTFGLLNAMFKDALDAKKKTDIKIGAFKMVHRLTPIFMAPFFPILAILGYIFGTSRAFNKIITPILTDPGKDYPDFLRRIIDNTMKIAEGDLSSLEKDRFIRAFVVSDRLVDAIKPDVLRIFSIELSKKMSEINPDTEVPNNYVDSELKTFLNDNYNIDPKIPLKNKK